MADMTLVYWRDIPAQVTLGKGRSATRVILPERFEQAIDRAAMKSGLSGTDAYLNEWRRETVAGEDPAAMAARIEAEYDSDRLRALIANDGWNPA
ncbi:virulence factor [Paracoccus sp. TK19116]|uniref:Virulence factor n=1 Tax=Paracoccus albicereus TaxID=2922394 RepID=A0ABT1MQ27_9RHOB|nr:virulence factor [Paracoccus albicereus]MCQ0970410.1 virulence factor [Paracoccus albicereus]